ncbi:MAG: NAD(P)/FAD-dependent oxidoreductase [Terriglobales bacterium]
MPAGAQGVSSCRDGLRTAARIMETMDSRTVVIVGAGVVGVAVAAAAAARFSEVYLMEARPKPGMMTSSRNSGVLHSGIYYAPGSLKGRLCLRGNLLLREFCDRHGVPWRACGKLIVAAEPAQEAALAALFRRGQGNGVEGLAWLDGAGARRREPQVRAYAAIAVPSAGVLNADALVRALLRLATDRGAAFAPGTQLVAAEARGGRIRLRSNGEDFLADLVVNAAGLHADDVARMFGETRYQIHPMRGEYCHIHPRRLEWVRGLIYPLPTPMSLGMHATRTVDDSLLLGPTAHPVADKEDYEAGWPPLEFFLEQGRHLFPALEAEDLTPAYSGIRPKLVLPAGDERQVTARPPEGDFVVARDDRHPGVIHLIGIESPGLTACLSLAEDVLALLLA